jgi:purine-binding chemotaxis protein CheW
VPAFLAWFLLKPVNSVVFPKPGKAKDIVESLAHEMCGRTMLTKPNNKTKGKRIMAELAKTMDQAVRAMADKEGKYLTFSLANEEYGIGILKIKEIIGMMPITTVPQTPEFVKGVINLRGKVIPVIDLRLRFGIDAMDYTERTCIIVVEIEGTVGTVQLGIVVDSVSEVLNIKGEDVEETPTFGTKLNTDYILGMAKIENSVKILLDIDKVLRSDEVEALEKAA